MPALDLDSDVHAYILGASRATGVSPSVFLRGTFDLSTSNGASRSLSGGTPIPRDGRHRDLLDFLDSPQIMASRVVTKKYLALLGYLHRQDPKGFERVLDLSGRHRKYFGRSRDEIARSGKSLHPRPVPGSPYWVMTNADTAQKRDLVRTVLTTLGYERSTAEKAARSIT